MKISLFGTVLQSDTVEMPAQHSANIKVDLEIDARYRNHTIVPILGYTNNEKVVMELPLEMYNNSFVLPKESFARVGYIYVSLLLYKDGETIKSNPLRLRVNESLGGTIASEETYIWQDVVFNAVDRYIGEQITPVLNQIFIDIEKQNNEINNLLDETKILKDIVNALQIKVDESVEEMLVLINNTIEEMREKINSELDLMNKSAETLFKDLTKQVDETIDSTNTQVENTLKTLNESAIELQIEVRQTATEMEINTNNAIASIKEQTDKLQESVESDVSELTKNVKDVVDLLNRKIDNGDFIPEHKWEDTTLSFKNPDGEWSDGVNLKGEAGSIKNATAGDITTNEGSNVQVELDTICRNGWVTEERIAKNAVSLANLSYDLQPTFSKSSMMIYRDNFVLVQPWQAVPFNKVFSLGNAFEMRNGEIRVLKDVNVMISAYVYKSQGGFEAKIFYLQKRQVGISAPLRLISYKEWQHGESVATIPQFMTNLKAGEMIYICCNESFHLHGQSGTASGDGIMSYISIQEL